MRRVALAVILGAMLGGAMARYLSVPDTRGAVGLERLESVLQATGLAGGRSGLSESASDGPLKFSDRVAVYEFASEASVDEILARLENVATEPDSTLRRFELAVLVARLAELDPQRAFAALGNPALGRAGARAIGLELLDRMGVSTENIDTIAAAMPQSDRREFRLLAISALASTNPGDALQIAQSIATERERGDAVRGIGDTIAEQNPRAALEYAATIDDDNARLALQLAAVAQLARVDILAAINFVEREFDGPAPARRRLTGTLYAEIGRLDPSTALEISRLVDGPLGINLEVRALERLAGQNALAAFDYAQGLPPGERRRRSRQAVARAFSGQDPDTALAWARTLDPLPPEVAAGVLGGIAAQDPLAALDLIDGGEFEFEVNPFRGPSGLLNSLFQNSRLAPGVASAIGDRLLEFGDEKNRSIWLDRYISLWSFQDAEGAFDWLAAHNDPLPSNVYSHVAESLANSDPVAAVRRVGALPAAVLPSWLGAVANAMVSTDPSGAVAWVEQFRGESVYETLAGQVAASIARSDPSSAVVMFESLSSDTQADFATELARSWTFEDRLSVRNWILGLPTGPVRDAAMGGYVNGLRGDLPDAAMLVLFSSDHARQEALLTPIARLARSRPSEARELIDTYISDPELRQRAERIMLDNAR